ncbi:AglZ/HisF2 family acetamidino modification protein [Chryseobacterium sp.]|uniref:AglZ/HisF2 family acetamidino modification protein n=1 Tax=Chryseobacterium sp. TaxID=1871047 RepID=UPI00388FFB11
MLKPRLIPSLLIEDGLVVKTTNFKNPKYIGDPVNTVKIFNEKHVDEICIFDISATRDCKEPNYKLIGDIASQSRMPICYGGGIKTVEQAQKIFNLGIEKIALSSILFTHLDLVNEISNKVGSQSVVLVIDVKKRLLGGYDIYTHNGTKNTKTDLIQFLLKIKELQFGEIIINTIDLDGTEKGYDFQLVRKVFEHISKPITILGGAGSLDQIKSLYKEFKIIGAAAGSLFIFKGKFKAVLINYPDKEVKNSLY